MFHQERQKKILEYIRQKPSVSVTELSDIFKVSTVTIRKDLNKLNGDGKIERTHGGAMSLNKSSYEETEDAKESINIAGKQEIAAKALPLVEEGSTILLDAGSTTLELAKLLVEKKLKGVTIITYALNIANVFSHSKEYNLVMLGGQFRHGMMSFVGPYTVQMLKGLHADRGFLGINGYTLEEGLTTPNPYEAEVKRNIVARSKECYLMADTNKYGKAYMAKVADISDIDGIITNAGLSPMIQSSLEERGVRIFC
ncbi:MAG: DeoR/GlpR family DNA-binding transcription regulator [Eubacteriales bacterium]|nr:DeoR/GlpR family DNA-binding transcription regulator [Eubacteriales bacterium]